MELGLSEELMKKGFDELIVVESFNSDSAMIDQRWKKNHLKKCYRVALIPCYVQEHKNVER